MNFEKSYHLRYWQRLNLNLDTELIAYIWLNWYHDSVFIYIIVGEWYRSHICGRSPFLRYTCTSCSRRRVRSAEKQFLLVIPTTPGLPDYCIVLLGCQKYYRWIILLYICWLVESYQQEVQFSSIYCVCSAIARITPTQKLHLKHSKYIYIMW